MSFTIIYHKNCMDGILSAYAALKYLSNFEYKLDVNFLPMNYGDCLPLIHNQDKLIIVDFSLSYNELSTLEKINSEIILIDHHESAILSLKDKLPSKKLTLILEKGRAGCILTWEHFHPDTPIPGLFSYAADRDLWQWQLYKSKEINAALRANMPKSMEDVEKLIKEWDPEELAIKGSYILEAQDQKIAEICQDAGFIVINGYGVPCVPEIRDKSLISEVCSRLLDIYPKAPFSVCYVKDKGKGYVFSLRSRSDFDCTLVAKVYGGGGHKQAAGFDIARLEDLESGS